MSGIKAGETLTVQVAGRGYALPVQAMWSLDGRTWQHTPPGGAFTPAQAHTAPGRL